MRKLILLLLTSMFAHASLNDVDRSELAFKNILKNPGFESGRTLWTASGGSFATATSGSNLLTGRVSATWDSSSASQTLTSTAITIPKGLYGRNGLAQCKVMTPSGSATHTISAFDGTNTLSSATIVSSTTPTVASVNFVFPASGSLSIRLTSVASDEPSITIDDCYLGDASNISSVSQAQFIGSAYFATTAACTFTRTNTALGALSDSDCPGPTVEANPGPGVIQTTDADAPKVSVNSLPPGVYEVGFEGDSVIGTSAQLAAIAINDGTNTFGQTAASNLTTASSHFSVKAFFTYTTTANHTFELYASSAANAFNIDLTASNQRLFFYIKKFPNQQETTYSADKLANSWSGYHDGNCTWTTTSNTLTDPGIDASCTFTETTNANFGTVITYSSGGIGNTLPGIVFTPTRTGRYFIIAETSILDNVASAPEARLSDTNGTMIDWEAAGTATTRIPITLHGIYNATTTASTTIRIEINEPGAGTTSLSSFSSNAHSVSWTIFQIDQGLPSPIIQNSVTNSAAAPSRIEVANINCDAGSAITSQQGSWVSSVGNVSGGACAITLLSGIFSGTPYCVVSPNAAFASLGLITSIAASSSTALSVDCEDDASTACTSYDVNLMCVGPR